MMTGTCGCCARRSGNSSMPLTCGMKRSSSMTSISPAATSSSTRRLSDSVTTSCRPFIFRIVALALRVLTSSSTTSTRPGLVLNMFLLTIQRFFFRFGTEVDAAAMFLDDGCADCQAQTGTATFQAGSEERLHDPGGDLRRYTAPLVGNGDKHLAALRVKSGADRHSMVRTGQRQESILDQIDDNLFQLTGASPGQWQPFGKFEREPA